MVVVGRNSITKPIHIPQKMYSTVSPTRMCAIYVDSHIHELTCIQESIEYKHIGRLGLLRPHALLIVTASCTWFTLYNCTNVCKDLAYI